MNYRKFGALIEEDLKEKKMIASQAISIEKRPESQAMVRFQDCDPFNHLNNSRYLDYFLNAWEDNLKKYYGIDIYKMLMKTGMGWVIGENQIAYLAPVKLMETIVIQTSVIFYSKNFVGVEFLMRDMEERKIKALMWTKYVHVEIMKGRSAVHSEDLMDFFESILLCPEGNSSFEERLSLIKSKKF